MTCHEWIAEGLRYDSYANRAWLAVMDGATDAERKTFHHILGASKIWLARMHGVSMTEPPVVPLTAETIDELESGWLEALETAALDQEIAYRNLAGEPYSRTLADIVRHVVNHSTYHRGQLRESFGQRGAEFPETDFIRYTFARDEILPI